MDGAVAAMAFPVTDRVVPTLKLSENSAAVETYNDDPTNKVLSM